MPLGEGQIDSGGASDPRRTQRDSEVAGGSVQLVRLVFGSEEQPLHVGNGGSTFSDAPAMVLQYPQGDLDGAQQVHFEEGLVRVCQPMVSAKGVESSPAARVRLQRMPDGLVGGQSKRAKDRLEFWRCRNVEGKAADHRHGQDWAGRL